MKTAQNGNHNPMQDYPMPFVTDETWSPARYRTALAVWQRNAPKNESEVVSRKAKSRRPRHKMLVKQARVLLTWREIMAERDWSSFAVNDNIPDDDGKPAPMNIDRRIEVKPSDGQIMSALKDVRFTDMRHARVGGGGALERVPVGGDIERGQAFGQPRRKKSVTTIVRLGRACFSNGANEEPALVKDEAGRIRCGTIRIPLGGLVRLSDPDGKVVVPADRWTKPRGAPANDNRPAGTASRPAIAFEDPLERKQEAARLRTLISVDTAALLDLALTASNFEDIGRSLGHTGKHAERKGKAALLKACDELRAALRA